MGRRYLSLISYTSKQQFILNPGDPGASSNPNSDEFYESSCKPTLAFTIKA
jgi:hypothetical protein